MLLEVKKVSVSRVMGTVYFFEEVLKRGVELGEFSISDPKLMAHNIVVMGHSWALRRWYLRKYWTFETFVREQADAILRTIRRDTIVECE